MPIAYELRVFRIRALQRAYFARHSDLPLLEEQISLLREVIAQARLPGELDLTPASLALHHYHLGMALYERHMYLRDKSSLEHAQVHLQLSVPDLLGATLFPGPCSILGSVLRQRAYFIADSDMAEQAVLMHRQLHESSEAIPTLEKAHHARELGMSLRMYSFLAHRDDAVLESIQYLQGAQALNFQTGSTDHVCAHALCSAFLWLFELKTNKSDLEEAISHGALAAQSCESNHRDFYRVIDLACHGRLTWIQGSQDEPEALNQIITTLRGALRGAPAGWRGRLLDSLGVALDLRFQQERRDEDLAEILSYTNEALTGLQPDEPDWTILQRRLSLVLLRRFEVTGAPEDIEGAASAAQSFLLNAVTGAWPQIYGLSRLGVCRMVQYKAFGDLAHLHGSIAMFEQLMQLTAPQSLDWKYAMAHLLEASQLRYEATGNVADLDTAVKMVPVVLAGVVDNADILRPKNLHSAGKILLLQSEASSSPSHLAQATVSLREAAEGHNDHSYEFYERVSTYARVLRIRYEILCEEESAAQALQLHKKIIEFLPDTHPDRAGALCALARLQLCTYTNQNELANALDTLLSAVNSHYCPAYRRLRDVTAVLAYLFSHISSDIEHKNAIQLSIIYSTAVDLLHEAASFGLSPSARLAVIAGASSLTTWGATHAISIGRVGLALQILEAGRSVFWTQNLQLRTSFMDLPTATGDRLTKITYALARPFPDELQGSRRDSELTRRRQLGDEFKSLVDETRALPGFENLLRNTPYASLTQAARSHPVVVLMVWESSGYAIVVEGGSEGQCRLLTLENVTAKVLQELMYHLKKDSRQARSSRGIRQVKATHSPAVVVYRELWELVMWPIIESMQLTKSEGRSRRRLYLCPTGIFMQLPLHAAGIYTGPDQVSCSDYFVSSYTPSIAALLHAQQSAKSVHRSQAEILLVAVSHPFQGEALPMAGEEAVRVRRLVSSSAKVVQVSSCSEVLEHIQSASILHLACHGAQDPANALQSSFHLTDGPLPVSKLMELDLPSAFLVVLSACETAKGDAAQPDQAIHLAATMLFAGFKSVVATMWFMGDSEGPEIAESIYSALFKQDTTSDCLDPEVVPYALDDAVQKLRRSGLDPSFWATYIHIGV